jgi:hypothetical protein
VLEGINDIGFGAGRLPFQGAGYYTPAGEATREAVNTWIRTSAAFDGIVDTVGPLPLGTAWMPRSCC